MELIVKMGYKEAYIWEDDSLKYHYYERKNLVASLSTVHADMEPI